MANLWVTRKEEVRQALHIAQEAKQLACAIKTLDSGRFVKLVAMWERQSDALIESFEFFLENAANIPGHYRYQAWIDMPPIHLQDIKKGMASFGVDVETLIVPLPQPEPELVVEQRTLPLEA